MWYAAQRTGLGAEFPRAIATIRDQLARNADRYPVTRGTFRWVKPRRFPCALHFDFDADCVRVQACLHFRQSPARWSGA